MESKTEIVILEALSLVTTYMTCEFEENRNYSFIFVKEVFDVRKKINDRLVELNKKELNDKT